jgi:hypothetical protein
MTETLITQRSVVQIHPPQPNLSISYGRFQMGALSISPKISPKERRDLTDRSRSLPKSSARISGAQFGLLVAATAHRHKLCLTRADFGVPACRIGGSAVIRGVGMVAGSTGGLPQNSQSALLTESQSAKHLGIFLSTLRRWRRKGIGPSYFFLSGILRYRASDLDEFIAKNTQRGLP